VALRAGAGGLDRASVANVSQTLAVDRMRLLDEAGALERTTMRQADQGLRLVLGL
jgi:mRNA interferase MazF